VTSQPSFRTGYDGCAEALAAVFQTSFGASEGAAEGQRIATLFADLIRTTPACDLTVFSAWRDETALGCIAFTRLRYGGDPRQVVLLSPVAVIPDAQRMGVGQALIAHGLNAMRRNGADIAVTYGDPQYYSKSGFAPVSVETIPAPQPLSMPFGWQAIALNRREITPFQGAPSCAPAWDDSSLW
jgi:predicted N-acetyltransferase YhbS